MPSILLQCRQSQPAYPSEQHPLLLQLQWTPPKLPSPLQLKRSLSQPKDFSSARKLQNPHNLPKATSLSQNPSSLPASKRLNKSSPLKRSLQPPTSLSPPKTQSASLSKSHVLKLQCYRKSHPKSSRKPPPRKDTMLQKTLPSSLWNPSLPKAPMPPTALLLAKRIPSLWSSPSSSHGTSSLKSTFSFLFWKAPPPCSQKRSSLLQLAYYPITACRSPAYPPTRVAFPFVHQLH